MAAAQRGGKIFFFTFFITYWLSKVLLETSLPVRPIGNVQNPTASSSSRIGLQVAAAQRASGSKNFTLHLKYWLTKILLETSLPVRPIGNVQPRGARAPSGSSHSLGLQVPNIIAPANSKHNAQCMPPPPLPPGHNSRIAPLQQRGSGPVVSGLLAGSHNYASQPFPPLFQSTAPVITGYQDAHNFYNEMREHYSRKAYSNSLNIELVVVKARMMTLPPGKKNPTLVWVSWENLFQFRGLIYSSFQNLFESIPNVHVHIGAAELKSLVYFTLLPKYLQWSHDTPLKMDECELRTKDWVEILPKFPDIDAISEKFFVFKGRNKTVKMFNAKSGIDLSLVIQHDMYEAILSHLQDLEEAKHAANVSVRTYISNILQYFF